ncbi:hypothetical protein [Nocardiopsis dassonvillei]|uniref:hypothetical protein n=1 Tax=Nocardiopsis dassonvillei TaxID=2014 RepID=UPI0036361867
MRDLFQVIDIEGAVITVDAMHTQHETARTVQGQGAHHVFTVKANNKHLYAQLKNLPWKHVPTHTPLETGHGLREKRTIKTAEVPEWIAFEGAVRIAQLRRTIWRKKSKGSATRTKSTTFGMSPTTRTAPRSVGAAHPRSWPLCATPRSGYCGRPGSTTSPRPTVT